MDISIDVRPLYSTSYSFTRYGVILDQVEQAALASGLVTEDELSRWHRNLEQADAEGIFFAQISTVLLAGRKPS